MNSVAATTFICTNWNDGYVIPDQDQTLKFVSNFSNAAPSHARELSGGAGGGAGAGASAGGGRFWLLHEVEAAGQTQPFLHTLYYDWQRSIVVKQNRI